MDTSIVIKALSIYLVVGGLSILFRGKTLPLVLKDFMEHRATMWLAGVVLIFMGSPLVFSANQTLFVTVIGWLIIAKGVVYLLFPEIISRSFTKISRPALVIYGIIIILFGVYIYTIA